MSTGKVTVDVTISVGDNEGWSRIALPLPDGVVPSGLVFLLRDAAEEAFRHALERLEGEWAVERGVPPVPGADPADKIRVGA